MMNDRLFDLAMKVIANLATTDERTELDSALAGNPKLQEEFEQLRASAGIAKEVIPLMDAVDAEKGEFPAYARERLQTKVRETLGRPPVPERKLHWAWKWLLTLAPVTAVIVLLLVLATQPRQPVIQLAMLDTIGQTRGGGTNNLGLFASQWKGTKVQVFGRAEELDSWEKTWPDTGAPAAKIIYDPAAAEIQVLIRSGNTRTQMVFSVEEDLSSAFRRAETFIEQQIKH